MCELGGTGKTQMMLGKTLGEREGVKRGGVLEHLEGWADDRAFWIHRARFLGG